MARPIVTCVLLALVLPVVSLARAGAQTPAAVAGDVSRAGRGAPQRAEANTNQRPAGTFRGGVLSLRLVAQQARWHPEANDGPFLDVEALGTEGVAPSIPGPLIRVRAGTRIETSIRNALPDTLLIFGLSGAGGRDTVRIAPGATGRARLTAPDRPVAPSTDHVAIVGLGRPNGRAGLLLNGSVAPVPLERRREGTQRIRLINISPENNVIFTLSADSTPMRWRAIAKDGFELPAAQRHMLSARVHIFPGETYDFEFESPADVVQLRMKNPATGPGIDDITLRLTARP